MARYPRVVLPQRVQAREETYCEFCGLVFRKGDVYRVTAIQTSYMRGDDEVMRLCDECVSRPPEQLLKRLLKNERKQKEVPHEAD